jgi:perosamine synthetase
MEFFNTHISQKSIELVTNVLRSEHISEGPIVKLFEKELENRLGLSKPVAVNSGTSALHLALAIAGVGPGMEVILPAQTFVATGLVILMQGAKPVFADIQYDTGNIDPEDVRRRITERTKAIIPVHWGGYPCDIDEINEIAKSYNLSVVEDAAHALGAAYKGRPIGSISRFTAFSFQAIKHLTTGDGGAICCLGEDDYKTAIRRRWFDIDRLNSKPSILGEREYDATELGYKYHLNDIGAAIGLGNLDDFPKHLARRREIAKIYREGLKGVTGLKLLNYKPDRESAYWLFTILVEKRERFIKSLQAQGIPTSVVHLRIDQNSVFGGERTDLINQAKFNSEQVSIPIHCNMTNEDVAHVKTSIKSGW